MMRFLTVVLGAALLLAKPAAAQFLGDLECYTLGGQCVPTATLKGAYVKDLTTAGLATLQLVNGTEETRQLDLVGEGGLNTAQVQALIGGFFTDNAETGGITLVYNSGTNKIDVTLTATGTLAFSGLIGTIAENQIPDNRIINRMVADDAVGLPELSASGTASGTTFLRGDNSWAAVGAGQLTGTLPAARFSDGFIISRMLSNAVGAGLTVPNNTDGSQPAASAATIGRINIHGTTAYVGAGTYIPGTDATWTWTSIGTTLLRAATGDPLATWRGTWTHTDSIPNPQFDDYAFETTRTGFWQYIERGWTSASISRYQGAFASQQDAQAHVTILNRWAWWPGVGPRALTAYTAPTSAAEDYHWNPVGRLSVLDFPDTPVSFEASKLWRTNAAATAVEQVNDPEPTPGIPAVSRLPTVSTTSPDIVFLSHDYTEGERSDANLTVGFVQGISGYSDGHVVSAVGSIDKPSPLNQLIGGGSASLYDLETVFSFNQEWLESFDRIVIAGVEYQLGGRFVQFGLHVRRVQGHIDYSAASVALNFLRSDGTYYWTDAELLTHQAGLYEKIDGAYQRLTSKGFTHVDGTGEPVNDPTAAAQSYIDDTGRLWVSGDTRTYIVGQITSSTSSFENDFYIPSAATPGDLGTHGHFTYTYGDGADGFSQIQIVNGTPLFTAGLSWTQVWTYIATNFPTDENTTFRDDTNFLGDFSSTNDLAIELAERLVSTTFAADRWYFAMAGPVQKFDAFVVPGTAVIDDFFWRGPLLISGDVRSLLGLSSVLEFLDTPSAFAARRFWRSNDAGTAVEQVPEPVQRPSITQVGTIPTTDSGSVLYLTHDHYQGVRSDITVTTGFFSDAFDTLAGYDRGNRDHTAYGSTDRDAGPLEAFTGEGSAGSYGLARVWSFNRHWLDQFTHVVIDDTEYSLGTSQIAGGAYNRRITVQEPLLTGTAFTLNFKRSDDTYGYTILTTLINRAGIYQWNPDTTRYEEGLFGAFPLITTGLTVRVGEIYRVGSALYSPRSSFVVGATTLPPDGSAIEANWRSVSDNGFVYVSVLPSAGTVAESGRRRVYVVRADETAAPTALAHLKPTDATVTEMTAGSEGVNAGFDTGFGHLYPTLNIEALYEARTTQFSTIRFVYMRVAATGTIPREATPKSAYFREAGTTDSWWAVSLLGGADGSYISNTYTSSATNVEAGKRYEVVVRSVSAGADHATLVASPPTAERYEFHPGGVKWAVLPDADELDHNRISVEVLEDQIIVTTVNFTAIQGTIADAQIPDDRVTNRMMADDAVGPAELSAAGTPSASTFLRGDNTWAAGAGEEGANSFAGLTGTIGENQIPDNRIINRMMADDAVGLPELSAIGTPSTSTFLRGDNTWAVAISTFTGLTGTIAGNQIPDDVIENRMMAPASVGLTEINADILNQLNAGFRGTWANNINYPAGASVIYEDHLWQAHTNPALGDIPSEISGSTWDRTSNTISWRGSTTLGTAWKQGDILFVSADLYLLTSLSTTTPAPSAGWENLTAGTTVEANPAGTDGEPVGRLALNGTNFNIRPVETVTVKLTSDATPAVYFANLWGTDVNLLDTNFVFSDADFLASRWEISTILNGSQFIATIRPAQFAALAEGDAGQQVPIPADGDNDDTLAVPISIMRAGADPRSGSDVRIWYCRDDDNSLLIRVRPGITSGQDEPRKSITSVNIIN